MALAPTAIPHAPEPLPPEMGPLVDAIHRGDMSVVGEVAALWQKHPNCPELGRHLVFLHAVRNEQDQAIAVCRELLRIDPDDQETRLCIADRLTRAGRLDEAENAYQDVLGLFPGSEDATAGLRYVAHLRQRGGQTEAEDPVAPLSRPEGTEHPLANRRLNLEEYEAGRLKLRSLPPRLNLEGTHRCNFYCQTCMKGHGAYYAADMAPEVIARVREEMIPSVMAIGISGYGEPTIGRRFDEILEMSVSHGATLDMTTNATGLSYRRIEQMIRHKVGVSISVDGGTKETFERIRLGGNFDQLLDRLTTILRLRRIYADQLLSAWHFNFVALRSNIHELAEVVRLAARYAIATVNVLDYRLNWIDFDSESLRNDPALANRCFAEAREVAKSLGVQLRLPPEYVETSISTARESVWRRVLRSRRILPKRRRFPQKCASPWHHPFITPDGDVQPCCAYPSLGSMRNRPFEKVWNGWPYRLLRWRIHTVLPPLACRGCHVETGINAGNPGNCIAQEGLIIKALYWLEIRLERVLARLRRRPGPKPNYDRGRPIPGMRA